MYSKILLILIALILVNFAFEAYADIVYLKNGNEIEGFVVRQEEDGILLEVGFGTIEIEKGLIKRIDKSNPEQAQEIYKKWEKEKLEAKERLATLKFEQQQESAQRKIYQPELSLIQREAKKELQSEEIEVSRRGTHIYVEAVLNNKIRAKLFLDTGASLVILTNKIARHLDLAEKGPTISLILADGKKTKARYVRLKSINVEGAKAENVEAAILLEDINRPGFFDGLLGMSFLKKFNFKVDRQNNRLILEELE